MLFFKKNITCTTKAQSEALPELIDKFNHIESKIDNIKFIECDCKSLLQESHTELTHLQNSSDKINQSIVNIENKYLSLIVQKFTSVETEYRVLNTLLQNSTNKLNQSIVNIENKLTDYKNESKENDLSLRTDLQTFLVGLQTNILNSQNNLVKEIKTLYNENKSELQTNILNSQTNLVKEIQSHNKSDKINDICNSLESINNNVKSFYYDNEIIKHQLMLEEDIQKYNDEIDNIRTLAVNAKNSIQETLINLQKELEKSDIENFE